MRFTIGTRPVRTKYRNSTNANVRNDALQVELIRDTLSEGDLALDVGAHAGQYGLLMTTKCGESGDVVCFEPDPEAIIKLERNFALNKNFKTPQVVRAACSDKNGEVSFFTQGGNSQSSLAISALPSSSESREIKINTIRLDEWWKENTNRNPKLIKIDTEGAEVHVLRGMPELLATDAVIVCELHPFAWEEMKVTLEDLDSIVRNSGRKMSWLDGSGPVSSPAVYGTVVIEK